MKRKPRLLFLAPGSWVHGRRALRAALATGMETVFVDCHNPEVDGNHAYKFIRLPKSGYGLYRKLLPANTATHIKNDFFSWWFKRLWARVLPDLVHVCWIDHRAAFCCRAGMRPLILSCWGSDVNLHIEQNGEYEWRSFVVEALSGASLTIVDSPAMSARCEMLAGRSIRSEMLHLGVDTDRFRSGLISERRAMRYKLKIPESHILFSSIRAMSAGYNHELILDAFAHAVPKFRRPAYLLFKIYNADTGYLDHLIRKAQQYRISDRVRLIEEIPEAALPALYAASDIIINFPQRDAFPVTLLEAASSERLVISASLDAYLGVISDDNITWVPPNDGDQLAAAMVAGANEYSYSEHCFPTARATVVESFSEVRYQQQLAAIYKSFVS